MGRSTSYTLRYDYEQAPDVLAWRLVQGDIIRKLDGRYELRAVDGGADRTEVRYQLEVDLLVPAAGVRQAARRGTIMHTALRQLRDHLEH